jgi:hypothetical protein
MYACKNRDAGKGVIRVAQLRVMERGAVPLERAFFPSSCCRHSQCRVLVLTACAGTYGRGDGAAVRRGALGGEVDAIGSLELDLEGS